MTIQLKRRLARLKEEPWCSQMVCNSLRQGRARYITSALRYGGYSIVDSAIIWRETAQGHGYWQNKNSDFGTLY